MDEIIDFLLEKEKEYVSQFVDTSNLSSKEIDELFDKLVKENEKEVNQV
jgi:hypothetical protein